MREPGGTKESPGKKEYGVVFTERLRVHGTRNVRVVDASVFPVIATGKNMSTMYAIAGKAADIRRIGGMMSGHRKVWLADAIHLGDPHIA